MHLGRTFEHSAWLPCRQGLVNAKASPEGWAGMDPAMSDNRALSDVSLKRPKIGSGSLDGRRRRPFLRSLRDTRHRTSGVCGDVRDSEREAPDGRPPRPFWGPPTPRDMPIETSKPFVPGVPRTASTFAAPPLVSTQEGLRDGRRRLAAVATGTASAAGIGVRRGLVVEQLCESCETGDIRRA
jgi:hypothetical protein